MPEDARRRQQLRYHASAILALLDQEPAHAATAPPADELPDVPGPDMIPISVAAQRAGVSVSTVRRWCVFDQIGRRYRIGWRVHPDRLRQLLAKER